VTTDRRLAFVFTGGGARAAYQVGFLRYLASRYPDLSPGILTGVSAGGLIAAHLGARPGRFADSVSELADTWRALHMDDVFRMNPRELSTRFARWGLRLMSGGTPGAPHARSLLDTTPLRELLPRVLRTDADGVITGIADSLAAGRLCAVALTASSYTTGQSVTWNQGLADCGVRAWERPQRRGVETSLTIDHVLATSAIPFFFPAVRVGDQWYGDGGIRMTAPLSPALHLGARRIMAVSSRYVRTNQEANAHEVSGYPPPAQVAGLLLNSIFLDQLDNDALRMKQVNELLDRLPADAPHGLQRISMFVLRPSQDLGRVATEYEAALPPAFRFLIRGLGSRETRSNDMLSLLLFHPEYLTRAIELGESDARARAAEIDAFLSE
jgi:NTE family protein